VAAVGVAGGVGVVLEQVDVADHAVVAQAPLRRRSADPRAPLAGLVMRDELDRVVALGVAYSGWLPTSRYRRAPLRRKTLLLRPQETTRRKR
jgi:hypothetical protein